MLDALVFSSSTTSTVVKDVVCILLSLHHFVVTENLKSGMDGTSYVELEGLGLCLFSSCPLNQQRSEGKCSSNKAFLLSFITA